MVEIASLAVTCCEGVADGVARLVKGRRSIERDVAGGEDFDGCRSSSDGPRRWDGL